MRTIPSLLHGLAAGLLLLAVSRCCLAQEEPQEKAAHDASTNDFVFEGGHLRDFVEAVKKSCNIDLEQEATIDRAALWGFRVPKMKVPISNRGEPLNEVLYAYNSVSRAIDERIGKWATARPLGGGEIVAIVFMPPRQSEMTGEVKSRAFSVVRLSADDRAQLREDITAAAERMRIRAMESGNPADLNGSIQEHRSGEILLATGSVGYVELASALVEAYKERAASLQTQGLRGKTP